MLQKSRGCEDLGYGYAALDCLEHLQEKQEHEDRRNVVDAVVEGFLDKDANFFLCVPVNINCKNKFAAGE